METQGAMRMAEQEIFFFDQIESPIGELTVSGGLRPFV
jgi:hypothetical protein